MLQLLEQRREEYFLEVKFTTAAKAVDDLSRVGVGKRALNYAQEARLPSTRLSFLHGSLFVVYTTSLHHILRYLGPVLGKAVL